MIGYTLRYATSSRPSTARHAPNPNAAKSRQIDGEQPRLEREVRPFVERARRVIPREQKEQPPCLLDDGRHRRCRKPSNCAAYRRRPHERHDADAPRPSGPTHDAQDSEIEEIDEGEGVGVKVQGLQTTGCGLQARSDYGPVDAGQSHLMTCL